MSKDIILKTGQTGYDVVAEYVYEYWAQTYYGTAIVFLEISYDGKDYYKTNEIVECNNGEIEAFLNDWWEGQEYIRINGIINIDEIDTNEATFAVDISEDLRNAYNDGARDFAERIKRYYDTLGGSTSATLVSFHVDEILKEFLEDNNVERR